MAEVIIDTAKFESAFYYIVEAATGEKRSVETPNLTSYALDNFVLYFAPVISEEGWPEGFSDRRIVWDYGDGTRTESVTGTHSYNKPGYYTVRSFLYSNDGEAYENSYTAQIEVIDFIEDKIKLNTDRNTCDIQQLAGEIKNPIKITQFNNFRTYNKSGISPIITYPEPKSFELDLNYFDSGRANQTYGHLVPAFSFFENIDGVENIPISAIERQDYDNIYVTVSAQQLVTSIEPLSSTSFLAGVSSESIVYFKSDIPGDFDLKFGFKQGSIFSDFTNTTNYGLSARICENPSIEKLSITTNGIDGDNLELDTFNINPVKFSGVDTAFVVKIKDNQGFANKALPVMEINPLPGSDHLTIDLTLTDGVTTYDANFYSDFNNMSSYMVPGFFNGYAGGFFKGFFNIKTDQVLEDVWILASTEVDGVPLSGVSNKFTIYPKDYYKVAKYGEDIDFNDTFQEVAIQPLFTDSRLLMNDFLGSIFGSIESAQDSIGKSTYEKIQNFLDNNTVVDLANIDQLAGILKSIKLPRINTYSLPPKIKRLMNLLSISQSRLFGTVNQNREDFNSYGYLNNEIYGTDRCQPIPENGYIFPDFEIVAFEKYSGNWTTLNSRLPLSASNPPIIYTLLDTPITGIEYDTVTCFGDISCTFIQTEDGVNIQVESQYFNLCVDSILNSLAINASTQYFRLSDFNETWGWNITPDKDGSIFDVYNFYYKTSYDKTIIENSVINFNDPNTTINTSYTNEEWSSPNGVMSNIFSNALYDGLGLMK